MIKPDKLATLPYFTLETARQISELSPPAARQLLSRWTKAGKIIRLRRGCFMPREFWLEHKNTPDFIALVSGIIQPHSYLTGTWILQKYGVMTEGIYSVTAATAKHTRVIRNPIATFYYTHIRGKLFTGYNETNYAGLSCREATAAKALFDYFYFKNEPATIESERLNLSHWGKKMKAEFFSYITLSGSPKMRRIAKNLQENLWV